MTTIEPLTADEAREFLCKARDHRLYGLWVTVLMLGLRRSEALGLHWSDVDLDKGTLRISRGLQRARGELRELPTKTRRSRRTVPLPPFVVQALHEHAHDEVVGHQLSSVHVRPRLAAQIRPLAHVPPK